MTCTRLYRCDLCSYGGDRKLLGLYWQTIVTGDILVVKPYREVEHHICLDCLKALQAIKLPDEVSGD